MTALCRSKGSAWPATSSGRTRCRPFIMAERQPGPAVVSEADLAAYAFRTCKTDHHPVGTCRMGVDDMAVVTPELKLRGIEALRVCDASIMPHINSSNTNAPTIMIGEKASDLVLGRPALPAVNLPPRARAA